jgi:osmotically-inducible protein OsmY
MSLRHSSRCRIERLERALVQANSLETNALNIGIDDALFARMSANNNRHPIAYAGVFLALFFAVSAIAETPATRDVTAQFVNAGAIIQGFRAIEVGGIVILRGHVSDTAAAEQAALVAQTLGFNRVANLIQIDAVPDDARIARAAERSLALQRGLDGTQIVVESSNGVVRLSGTVSNELQKDMAVVVVRNIDGVRSVQMALKR